MSFEIVITGIMLLVLGFILGVLIGLKMTYNKLKNMLGGILNEQIDRFREKTDKDHTRDKERETEASYRVYEDSQKRDTDN